MRPISTKPSTIDLFLDSETPLYVFRTGNFTLLSRSCELASTALQQVYLKLSFPTLEIPNDIKPTPYFNSKSYFEAVFGEERDLAQGFLNQSEKIGPLCEYLQLVFQENHQGKLNLAGQREPNSQIELFLQYCLKNRMENAFETALNFLKNFGCFPLYSGPLISVSGLSLLLFLVESWESGQAFMAQRFRDDLLLGSEFWEVLVHLKEGDIELSRKIALNLVRKMERKTTLVNAGFISAEVLSIFDPQNSKKIQENLFSSIQQSNHEIAHLRYFSLFVSKEETPITSYFSIEILKKWLFPSFLEALCEFYLIEGNEKEAMRFYTLGYFLGDIENQGILFTLALKAKDFGLMNSLAGKVKGKEGAFIKEVQSLIKLKQNEKALKILTETLLEREFDMDSHISKYEFLFGTYLLGKLRQEPQFYNISLLIILLTPHMMELFSLYILHKIVKSADSGYYDLNLAKKAKKMIMGMEPEVSFEYALVIGKGKMKTEKKGKKTKENSESTLDNLMKLMDISINKLRAQIINTIQYQSKSNAVSPMEYHYSDLFPEIAQKILYPWLSSMKIENSQGHLNEVFKINSENSGKQARFQNLEYNWLFDFIQETNKKNESREKPQASEPNLVPMKFKKDELEFFKDNTCKEKNSKIKFSVLSSTLTDIPPKNHKLTPFNLNIRGFFTDESKENDKTQSGFLTDFYLSELPDFLSKAPLKTLSNRDFLKILIKIAYLNVSANLSGFHGIFLVKKTCLILENYDVKILPFELLESVEFMAGAEKWDTWVPPELVMRKKGDCSKIDSWILGLLIFHLVFGVNYWDIYLQYAKSLPFGVEESSLLSIFTLKKKLIFAGKEQMSLEFIQSALKQNEKAVQEKSNIDPILENYGESREQIGSAGLKSEILSESVLSLPPSPLRSPMKKSHFNQDAISEVAETLTNYKTTKTESLNIKFDSRNLMSFTHSLVNRCLVFDPDERPSPLEILFELHKFVRCQIHVPKGIFEFVNEAALLGDLFERAKRHDSNEVNGFVGISDSFGNTSLKTPELTITCAKNGQGSVLSARFKFEGKMSGFYPKEGQLFHSILCPTSIPVIFEENSMIPGVKTRNEMLFRIEKKGKGITEFPEFQLIFERLEEHKGKPYLIDLFNNHYVCDYNSAGEPIFFHNPINNSSQSLFFANLSRYFCFHNYKIMIFDVPSFILTVIDADHLRSTNKIGVFELLELIYSENTKLELFSLNGFKFSGFRNRNEMKNGGFKGVLELSSRKVEISDSDFFRIQYPNGHSYEGNIINGCYSGEGKYTSAGQFTFQGIFQSDIFQSGTIIYHNSLEYSHYTGPVLLDPQTSTYLRHGHGTLYYQNDSYYKGDFSKDLFHGNGHFFDSKKKSIYEGEFLNGIKCGSGVLRNANGDLYKGEFRENKREGVGKEVYRNKDVYEGGFKEGKREGNGIYVCSKGGYYRGSFCRDRKNGDGVIKNEHNEKFVVKFYNDMLLRKKKVKEDEDDKKKKKVLSLL